MLGIRVGTGKGKMEQKAVTGSYFLDNYKLTMCDLYVLYNCAKALAIAWTDSVLSFAPNFMRGKLKKEEDRKRNLPLLTIEKDF